MLTIASCDGEEHRACRAGTATRAESGVREWIKAGATRPDTFRFSVRPGEQCKPNTTDRERRYADTAFVDFTIPARTTFEVKSGNLPSSRLALRYGSPPAVRLPRFREHAPDAAIRKAGVGPQHGDGWDVVRERTGRHAEAAESAAADR